jgi:hypothetical protein
VLSDDPSYPMDSNPPVRTAKSSAGSSAGSCSFCCTLVQHRTASEIAKPKNINALRLPAFWCSVFRRILSPARLPVSPLRRLSDA